ncbi:MAG: hypothetical protein AAGA56_08000 [Myxococcota bacterium]
MPTTGDDDIDLLEYADERGSTADAETYLVMEVASNEATPGGYLRLGGVDPAIKAKYAQLLAGETVDWGSDTSHGEDLASQVLTFIDDTRVRGPADESGGSTTPGDNPFRTLSQAERQAETSNLHTSGGWRDHTEGNRITTTRGDKIEVIRGNYKQRVLGRSQWKNDAGSGLHYESSGGVTYHYDEVPGQIVDVRWSDRDGTWKVFEECDTGHQVNRYHGVLKEWSRGGDVVDRIGSESAYDAASGTPRAFWKKLADGGFTSDGDFDKPSDAAHQAGVAWPSDKDLPDVSEETYANEVTVKLRCRKHTTQMGDFTRWVNRVDEKSHIESWTEEHKYVSLRNYSFSFGVAAELWMTQFKEVFDGMGISLKFGNFIDLRAGAAVECDAVIGKFDLKASKNVVDLEASVFFGDYGVGAASFDLCFSPTKTSASTLKTKTCGFKAGFAKFFFLG